MLSLLTAAHGRPLFWFICPIGFLYWTIDVATVVTSFTRGFFMQSISISFAGFEKVSPI